MNLDNFDFEGCYDSVAPLFEKVQLIKDNWTPEDNSDTIADTIKAIEKIDENILTSIWVDMCTTSEIIMDEEDIGSVKEIRRILQRIYDGSRDTDEDDDISKIDIQIVLKNLHI